MTRRKRRSLVRGNKIFLDRAPPQRWKPAIDRSIPIDYVRSKREGDAEDNWLPNEKDDERHPDEVGDEATAVAFLDEVLGDVLRDRDEVVGDDNDATESAADEEQQP